MLFPSNCEGPVVNPEFWHDRWQRGEIGWHQETINTLLIEHWPELGLAPGSCVFVPLCGKTRDLLWLAGEGHRVLGVELSELAVEGFFHDSGLEPRITEDGSFRRYAVDEIEILCGDFFDLDASQLAGVDAIYDRAALVALPPEMRPLYATHLIASLGRPVPILLITLDYPQSQMQGPPFAVEDAEVRRLFGPVYRIEALSSEDALAENPRFRERGLTRLVETVYRLSVPK
jgi:thiopurine S-methyltransferase